LGLLLLLLLLLVGGAVFVRSSRARAAVGAIIVRASAKLGINAPQPPPSNVTITVDPTRVIRPISPLIYGVSVAGPDELIALGARLNRWGGNPNTRYNWELGNAWNAARDYEFRNYGADQAPVSGTTSVSDRFVAANGSVDVQSEITVPAIGWVARNGDNATRSIGVPEAGGPPLAGQSDAIAGYDPTDNRARTSLPSMARKGAPFADPPDLSDGRVFQDEWVHHLVDQFGRADSGGVRYYAIDNEPDLWWATHTDVHPVQPSYDDMLATFVEYAEAIKNVDPSAHVLGPVVSGWTGYFYSARDQGTDSYRTHADRLAHGDMEFLPWWLEQVRKHDQQTLRRLLDVLDVHYYPQAAGVYSAADDPQTRALRLRSTRSLWDPTYVDESWIAQPVRLIPRLRAWIDQYYPGTLLAIGEWNWGAEKSMSGALAVADALGIFGREGVDLASYWVFPPPETPAGQAFAMYRHYDAAGDSFGDRAVVTSVDASPDYVTSYASVGSQNGDLVIIAINKRDDAALPATIRLSGGAAGRAEVYQYAPGDTAIQDAGGVVVAGSELSVVLQASSITLVRISR
jgi:Glycoside hydrolase family 44